MTRIQKKERMFALIKSWKSSDLTQSVFCLENGIHCSTFQYWLRKYYQNNDTPDEREKRLTSHGFVPIAISSAPDPTNPGHFEFLLEYPSGIRIFFGSVPDMGIIRELVCLQGG